MFSMSVKDSLLTTPTKNIDPKILSIFPSPSSLTEDSRENNIINAAKTKINSVSDYIKSECITPHPRGVHFAHVNAQSLYSHLQYFKDIFLPHNLHVIAVSESWLKSCITDDPIDLPGYKAVRQDRATRGGGIIIYIRDDIKYKILSCSNNDGFTGTEFIITELTINKVKFLFSSVYRPPKLYCNLDAFLDSLSTFLPLYSHNLITGDFNIDVSKNSLAARCFIKNIDSLNLNILPSKPTHTHSHKNKSTPTTLDLFITSNSDKILKNCQIEAPGLSHHDIIFLAYSLKQNKFKQKYVTFRDFKNIDINLLREDAKNIDWDSIHMLDDVNDMVTELTSRLSYLIEKHIPLKTVRVTHKPAPWRTQEVINLENHRDFALREYNKNKTAEKHEKYRVLRNRTKQVSRNSKIKYAKSQLNIKLPPKILWKNSKELGIGKQKTKIKPPIFTLNNLNKNFTTLPEGINKSYKQNTIKKIEAKILHDIPKFKFEPVRLSKIKIIIKNITTQAKGEDGISIDFIKLILDIILPTLTRIVNTSLITNTFPLLYKKARVHPLPKCSNPVNEKDYRPISILPVLSKVIEKIVFEQLTQFIHPDPFQSGFKAHHSTGTALLKITEDIRAALDKQQITILALLDFSKAFDTVDHDILIAKLKKINLHADTVEWFISYLKDRTQKVVSHGQESTWLPNDCGVPQGSILGPLLFSIYIQDAPEILKHCFYHMYADDFQIYLHSNLRQLNSTIKKMNIDLNALHTWSSENLLLLNPLKTQAMIIGHSRLPITKIQQSCPSLKINNTEIPFINSAKNLGVIIDSKLSWEEQANLVCKKAYGSLFSLFKLQKFIPQNLKARLISALVMPHFDYCDFVCSDITKNVEKRIQRVQNTCIKFIEGLKKYDHVSHIYKKLNILKCEQRRSLHALTLIYRTINTPQNTPKYISELITTLKSTHKRNNRSTKTSLLSIPYHRTARYDKSFIVKYSRMWNDLPTVIRESSSLRTFKMSCSAHLMIRQ
jgi:hypothetical protein